VRARRAHGQHVAAAAHEQHGLARGVTEQRRVGAQRRLVDPSRQIWSRQLRLISAHGR
jgi:hypothetical protein